MRKNPLRKTPAECLSETIDLTKGDPREHARHALALWRENPDVHEDYALALALALKDQPSQPARAAGQDLLAQLAQGCSNVALYNLAISKLTGDNTPVDPDGANTLLERVIATEQEDRTLLSLAINAMADTFFFGWGKPLELARALKLYQRAATLGCDEAAYNAGLFYHGKIKAWPGALDYNKAAHYYVIAAAAGHNFAITNLAVLHAGELIDGADPEYGERVLRMQAAEGDQEAAKALPILAAARAANDRQVAEGKPAA